MASGRRTKLNKTCNPFYLFLHGKPENGCLSLSTGVARSLSSDWEMALTDVSYNQTNAFEAKAEEIQLVMCSPAAYKVQYELVKSRLMADHATWISSFPADYFRNFPNACLVTLKARNGSTLMTPEGPYDFTSWTEEINSRLTKPDFFFGRGIKLFFENGNVRVSWHYCKGFNKQVFFFPCFGEHSRNIMGMPDIASEGFKDIINRMSDNMDTLLPEWIFPQRRTPLLIECNLCEHNGQARREHSCTEHSEGHVLRIIGQEPTLEFGRHLNLAMDNRYYVPVRASGFTEVKVRIISADHYLPACFAGHVSIVIHFQPRNPTCSLEDKEPHPRGTRSRPNIQTDFNFAKTYETVFRPFKTLSKPVIKDE